LGLDEDELGTIQAGQSIIIHTLGTDTQAQATIDYISPMVSESTRRATVRVVLDNPSGAWRPGQFVAGLVSGEGIQATVAVLHSAVQTLGGEDVVFLETPHGFRPQPVALGQADSTQVEIKTGLRSGQRYVRANAFTLKAELSKRSFVDDDD
jgi:cobalt-zinc-cadmium efflux system membrane fusion protein